MSPSASPLILIVDDFPDALEMYQVYLTVKGYRVLTATSGPDAIALCKAHHPVLVLMDLRMAGVDGTQAMRAIRADPACGEIPIVALTAHALDDERDEAIRSGFNEIISKPCLPEDLAAAVDRILGDIRPSVELL